MTSRRNFIRQTLLAGAAVNLLPSIVQAHEIDCPINPDKKRALRIAHLTDIHLLDKPHAETCYSRVLHVINTMTDKPDFIINTGDTLMDMNNQTRETVMTRWNVWQKIVQLDNKLPMYSALGNHDVWYGPDAERDAEYKKDKRYGKQWAIEMLNMPARYYAFTAKGWRFIALDSINGDIGYQLDDEQFNWLQSELARATLPVCVFNHVPILSIGALLYFTKRKPLQEITFPSGDMHRDHQRIKDLFHQHARVKLALSGHVHYVDRVEYLGVKYLCNGAVSGNWWSEPLALDEFPPVYTIIDLYEDGTSDSALVTYDSGI